MTDRCEDGRRLRHDPQDDDPYLETDIGKCEHCAGYGCDKIADVERCMESLTETIAAIPDDATIADRVWTELLAHAPRSVILAAAKAIRGPTEEEIKF